VEAVSGLRLVPLRCTRCQGRVSTAPGSAVLLCLDCGAGLEVTEDGSLAPVEVAFARYAAGSESFLPFWTFAARLALATRESTRGGAPAGGLAARFREKGALRFYCAAFPRDLEEKGKWSLRLTLEQPELAPAPPQKELGAVAFSQAEARALASDLFVTSELALPDTVRALEFELALSDPRVIAIAI
jgi:hypothetical protein